MNTYITRRTLGITTIIIVCFSMIAWLYPAGYFQLAQENDLIKSIKSKLTEYVKADPEDRLYVSMDKPMYSAGDDMWLSVFIRNGQTLKPSKKSDIVHIELINPKGTVEQTINVIANNGVAAGDFQFSENALGGLYKIRAYTNWMKNEGDDNAFVHEFQVQDIILPNLKMKLEFQKKAYGAGDEVVAKLELNTNENKPLSNQAIHFVSNLDGVKFIDKTDATDEEGVKYIKFELPKDLATNDGLLNVMIDYNGSTESVSRSIPIVLNNISIDMFPEGGDLVDGMPGNVAFRALDEFGKPADVEGTVVSEIGTQVATFSSFHNGMGAFNFKPLAGVKYFVKLTKPEGITKQYEVPAALPSGYVMNIDNSVKGQVGVNVNAAIDEELSLVAQVRGKIYYTTVINAKKGENKFNFSTAAFPIGVSQITLFDSKGIARAERLAFVNKDKQLSISIATDKQKYLPREKVKMTVTVKDKNGIPMPASLCLSVVNDQLLSFVNDKSGNLLSQFLLQEDIKDKVEEPAYYFDPKEADADKALDYLLMTSGWRRFTWENVLNEELPQLSYDGERAIVSGVVYDAYTSLPVRNAKLQINNGVLYSADTNGTFKFTKLDLSQDVTLTISADNYTSSATRLYQYGNSQAFYLYPKNYYYGGWRNWDAIPQAMRMEADDVPMAAAEGAGAVMVPKRAMVAEHKDMLDELVVVNAQQNQVADNIGVDDLKKSKDIAPMSSTVSDNRSGFFSGDTTSLSLGSNAGLIIADNGMMYHRARKFAAPVYDKDDQVDVRTDFRNTIYFNPDLEVDKTGTKTVEFYASDDITSFRASAEGIATDGTPGRGEQTFFSQLPFAMSTKVPVEVATEDNVSIPLTLKNNTDKPLGGMLSITLPDGLESTELVDEAQTIMPGKSKTLYVKCRVLDRIGEGDLKISFKSCGLSDAFVQHIKIAPKGFPVAAALSAQDKEKEFSFEPKKMVKGSLKIKFTAFPNVVNDLMKGVAGILQEPYGCFEQTSCTAYPNAMVLDYLKNTDSDDDATLARANDLLDRGYKRLTTFEAPDKGYEWFGANPGHEGLTAYGIMEFTDMKKAGGDVSQAMIDRTANWLLSHRDGNGGFNREAHAYHNFGQISNDILNAYIVFALAESGYTDVKKEYETSLAKAFETKDPYMLAMMANASYSLGEKANAAKAMDALMKTQAADGSFTGTTHSITYSQGKSLTIETTSLSIIAMLKDAVNYGAQLNGAVQFVVGSRDGYGTFASTQGTILALKALTEYAKFSKKMNEDGTIELYMDGNKIASKSYKAGDRGEVVMDSLEQYVTTDGVHTMKVKFVGTKNALPYTVACNWNTSEPASNAECAVGLTTALASTVAKVGETVRLKAVVTNRKNTDIPSTMAIIGIPAGFTVQPWQLKELQDKNVFDYYEMKGNNIAIYYRGMEADAVKEINLDLKAEIPGEYDAPASSAYLYYTNEFKTWTSLDRVTIQ